MLRGGLECFRNAGKGGGGAAKEEPQHPPALSRSCAVWRDDRYAQDTSSSSIVFDPLNTPWWPEPELINLDNAVGVDSKLELGAWTFSAQTGVNAWVVHPLAEAEPDNATWVMGVARTHAALAAEVRAQRVREGKGVGGMGR